MEQPDWIALDRASVWHPLTSATDPVIPLSGAEGCWLIGTDGRRYLDAISSWWVNLHGHGHPYIAQRVAQQAMALDHAIFAGFAHRPAAELAHRLIGCLPGQMDKIFFSDNGSTAIEVALKMAVQHHHAMGRPRHRFIAFEDGYHGDTFGTMAVGGRGLFPGPFDELLFEVGFIDPPVPGSEEESFRQMERMLDSGDIAAFIFEPLIQGSAGMRVHSAEALTALMRLAREAGALLIADEVMTGFGRTGTLFATQQCGIAPDLIALSKGITGGMLPMGATACTAAIHASMHTADRRRNFLHSHSYAGNPLACAAALASLDLLEQEATQGGIRSIAQHHAAFASEMRGKPGVADVRHLGTMLAVEFDAGGTEGYFSPLRDRIYAHGLANGVLLRPLGNVAYVLPPYSITEEELGLAYAAIRGFRP